MGFLSVVEKVTGVVDKFVPDKDKANELKSEIENALIEARSQIVTAEAQGSWLQRHWRPATMLVFVYIIFNNYILAQYLIALGIDFPILPIPSGMWNLLTLGLGGYIGARSVEKIFQTVKK